MMNCDGLLMFVLKPQNQVADEMVRAKDIGKSGMQMQLRQIQDLNLARFRDVEQASSVDGEPEVALEFHRGVGPVLAGSQVPQDELPIRLQRGHPVAVSRKI